VGRHASGWWRQVKKPTMRDLNHLMVVIFPARGVCGRRRNTLWPKRHGRLVS
jgi:hypothetical protein